MTDANAIKLSQACTALYAIYAVSMLMQFTPYTMIAGSVALLAAVVMAYVMRQKAGESFYETHLHWLIRTFWIGGVVFLPVLTVLASIAVMSVVDFSEMKAAIQTAALEHTPGEGDDNSVIIQTVMQTVMQKNAATIIGIALAFTLPVFGWWMWRCWKGYALLKAGKPVEDVMRWF